MHEIRLPSDKRREKNFYYPLPTSNSTPSCLTTWRSDHDHSLLWCHFRDRTLCSRREQLMGIPTGPICPMRFRIAICFCTVTLTLRNDLENYFVHYQQTVYTVWCVISVRNVWSLVIYIVFVAFFTGRRLAKRGICRRRVSVCLSVCVCVCHTPVLYQNG